jgi:hypothetical protein
MKVEQGDIWYKELSSKEVWYLYLSGMGKVSFYEKILAWLFPRQYPLLVDRWTIVG